MAMCLCGTEFSPANKRHLSCSTKCAHKYKPKHYKRHSLRRNYGMTMDEWDRMFEAQGGKCKICDIHQSDTPKALHVDHCHKTGKIRGLLCGKCNRGLGYFQDSTDFLAKAQEYLS